MDARQRETREQIVSLLRGQVACPLIASLAELGIVQGMVSGSFSPSDFVAVRNQVLLESCFQYLQSLGLLQGGPGQREYALTDLGHSVFRRVGAFFLLSSYREYFDSFSALLTGGFQGEVCVDRRLNVMGSGSLHTRKFFPSVAVFFGSNPPDALLDLGCGDGAFLEFARREWSELRIAAVDLSPVAIQATVNRLKNIGAEPEVTIVENAAFVDSWVALMPLTMREAHCLLISMWFVVHEFSEGESGKLVQFFRRVRQCLPQAEIILGEIVKIPSDVLAEDYEVSILPEFLLFHELSGQGVFSWSEWLSVLSQIPYQLSSERLFDLIHDATGDPVASSFVWHLKPT